GIAFGHNVGFLVGVLTPLISNLFLGHGPWTPLQMYAWGFIGAISGMLYPHSSINRWKLGAMGIISGYLYGFIMNIWFWYTYLYPANLRTFIFAELQGIPFDTLHSIGNFLFLTFFGNKLLTLFRGFKESLYINAQG
ncbi:MAG: ECF transporter S component, partial [Candidatus Bathyarchaeia archaeon]